MTWMEIFSLIGKMLVLFVAVTLLIVFVFATYVALSEYYQERKLEMERKRKDGEIR